MLNQAANLSERAARGPKLSMDWKGTVGVFIWGSIGTILRNTQEISSIHYSFMKVGSLSGGSLLQ